jgi:asparagine synthase (glutamine-hydrolysing)
MSNLLADRQSWPELREPLQAMKYPDFAGYLPDDCLVKIDRASMAAPRGPLPAPPRQARAQGAAGALLPRPLFERPKRGFGVPIGAWRRGQLRDWAETLLDEHRTAKQGYLQPTAVRTLWQQHLSGRRDCPELLWHVLMFQAWHEHWQAARIEPGPAPHAAGVPSAPRC